MYRFGIRSASKLIVRVVVLIAGVLSLIVSKGMQLNPDSLDRNVGIVAYIISVLFIFFVFFHWHRTAIHAIHDKKHIIILGVLFIIAGLLITLSSHTLLMLMAFGEPYIRDIFRTIVSERYDYMALWSIFIIAAVIILTGVGLILNMRWARFLAKWVALPISLGWPLGLALAIYTWWCLNPNRETGFAPVSRTRRTRLPDRPR